MRLEMAEEKLSLTEFAVLEVLYMKGRQTIQQVGSNVLISSGSMTYIIDKLETRGLLARSSCPSDRRAIYLALTAEGKSVMESIMPKHKESIDYIFDSLHDDEAEILVRLLKKISSRVEE
ncbi:MarR family transcriptional regulator [Mesobacillus zeae]|uniref:MarR family transcriptional regulator n=2 Tax=Mesobacillus zeae TaxID=1917180 RepID=A0A398AWL1_9BACI|nr:MarR family transcriptional regulator [Mesobacillus zeae]